MLFTIPAVIFELLPNIDNYYSSFVSLFQKGIINYEFIDIGIIAVLIIALIGLSRYNAPTYNSCFIPS
jgi:hypothetical protein